MGNVDGVYEQYVLSCQFFFKILNGIQWNANCTWYAFGSVYCLLYRKKVNFIQQEFQCRSNIPARNTRWYGSEATFDSWRKKNDFIEVIVTKILYFGLILGLH